MNRNKHLLASLLMALAMLAPLDARGQVRLTDEELREIARLPAVPPGLNGTARMTRGPLRKVRATLVYQVRCDALVAREWVFFSAVPPALPGQRLLKLERPPQARMIKDVDALARPLMVFRVPGNPDHAHEAEVRMVMDLALHSRKLELNPTAEGRPVPVEALAPDERALALRLDRHLYSHCENLSAWMLKHGLERLPREGEIGFARRVFLRIVENISYHYVDGHQDRRAGGVCAAGKSDCGGMSVLFVTILRSQGIPARLRAGRWAVSARQGERVDQVDYYQEHVKAEFHAHGVGWIPVDPSAAVLHDRTPGKLRFFGMDAGDFITFHIDTGIAVDSIHFGPQTLGFLQTPAFWVTGRGRLEDLKTRLSWTVAPQPDDGRD